MKILLIALGIWGLSAGATAAPTEFPGSGKVSPWVKKQLETDADLPIIALFKEKADLHGARDFKKKSEKGAFVYRSLREVALKSQPDLVQYLDDKGVKFERFYIVNMLAIYGASAQLVQDLAARSDIEQIIGNPSFHGLLQAEQDFLEKDFAGVEAAIVSTGAKKVWDDLNFKGEGIVIAGQDTGIQWDHPALKQQYRGWDGTTATHDYNWYDAIQTRVGSGSNPCGLAAAAPCDDNGHGTHTIGSIVGQDGDNQIGMAPAAKWIGCRNMDNGEGRATNYIKCFEFFLAPFPRGGNAMTDGRPELAPHVINNSWGCPEAEGCRGTEMKDVLIALKEAGIVTVVSAGNDGPRCGSISDQPAGHSDSTLSVGAHDHRSGSIASFSSRGPSSIDNGLGPDLTAPGVSIRSSVPGNRYQSFSGTSMAGPHVVGAVALLLSAKPQLIGNVQAVFDTMAVSATAKTSRETCGGVPGTQIPNNTFGHGQLDVFKAINTTL